MDSYGYAKISPCLLDTTLRLTADVNAEQNRKQTALHLALDLTDKEGPFSIEGKENSTSSKRSESWPTRV